MDSVGRIARVGTLVTDGHGEHWVGSIRVGLMEGTGLHVARTPADAAGRLAHDLAAAFDAAGLHWPDACLRAVVLSGIPGDAAAAEFEPGHQLALAVGVLLVAGDVDASGLGSQVHYALVDRAGRISAADDRVPPAVTGLAEVAALLRGHGHYGLAPGDRHGPAPARAPRILRTRRARPVRAS